MESSNVHYLKDYYVKASAVVDDIFVEDNHHLNQKGHSLLAETVVAYLESDTKWQS